MLCLKPLSYITIPQDKDREYIIQTKDKIEPQRHTIFSKLEVAGAVSKIPGLRGREFYLFIPLQRPITLSKKMTAFCILSILVRGSMTQNWRVIAPLWDVGQSIKLQWVLGLKVLKHWILRIHLYYGKHIYSPPK